MRRTLFLLALISISTPFATLHAEEAYSITPDVVYGHKSGMALTFDVFTPKKEANGAAVLFMVSGGWHGCRTIFFLYPLMQRFSCPSRR